MSNVDLFAEPELPEAERPWVPEIRHGRALVRLHPMQRVGLSVLCGGAALFAASVLYFTSIRMLVVVPLVLLIAIAPAIVAHRVGIEVGRRTIRVFGFGWRPRVFTKEEVRDFAVDERGRVALIMTEHGSVSCAAPRCSDGLLDDPDIDAKVSFLRRSLITPTDELVAPEPATVAGSGDAEVEVSQSRFRIGVLAGVFVAASLVGYLFVGTDVLILAVAMVVLLGLAREPGRPLALASFLLLILGAIATMVQEFPPTLVITYSTRRTVAAEFGAIVGLFLVLSTLIFSATERAHDGAPRWPVVRWVRVRQLQRIARQSPALVTEAAPYVAVWLGAALIRFVASPAALAPAYAPLIDSLRLGTAYSMRGTPGFVFAGEYPPLGPGLAAYFPLGPKVALLVVSMATVTMVGWYTHRYYGRTVAILAMAIAAVLPSLWAAQLPAQLAALFVMCGVALADPRAAHPSRSLVAGFCLGLAFLARPDAGVALLVVIAWFVVARRDRIPWGDIVTLVIGWTVAAAPWLNVVWTEVGPPLPTATLASTLNDPTATSTLPAFLMFLASGGVVALTMYCFGQLGTRRAALYPFAILPACTAVLAVSDPMRRDPLAWSAPMAAVVLGCWLSARLAGRLPALLGRQHADRLEDLVDLVIEGTPGRETPSAALDNDYV